MTNVWYCLREDIKSAPDIKETARNNAQIDRAIESASRNVEAYLHRVFAPVTATRYFSWPRQGTPRAWRLWLGHDDLISVTSLSSGGTTIAASDYFLEPVNEGPPYDSIEIDLDSTASFSSSGTHQRAITVTGVWGWSADETNVGTIAEALDASETAVDVDGATAALVGVGSVLKVDSERMLVTERATLTSGQTLQTDMTATNSNSTVAVTDGTDFAVGEVILLDSERMRIVDIAGNNLTVIRAWDGSTLATHSGSTIYGYRTLTVTRGALGTTAATHDSGATVYRWDVPGPVRELCVAEALTDLMQARSGWAIAQGRSGWERPSGLDDTERVALGRGLHDLRRRVFTSYGRKARLGVV